MEQIYLNKKNVGSGTASNFGPNQLLLSSQIFLQKAAIVLTQFNMYKYTNLCDQLSKALLITEPAIATPPSVNSRLMHYFRWLINCKYIRNMQKSHQSCSSISRHTKTHMTKGDTKDKRRLIEQKDTDRTKGESYDKRRLIRRPTAFHGPQNFKLSCGICVFSKEFDIFFIKTSSSASRATNKLKKW